MINLRKNVLLLAFAQTVPAIALADTSITLRSAEEPSPDNKKWERGAGFAYTSVDGKSTSDIDIVIKAKYETLHPLADEHDGGSIKWSFGLGPYLHKHRADKDQQHDRGGSASIGGHWKPGGDASGPVVNMDFGVALSAGKTLTETVPDSKQFLDVDKQRVVVTTAGYIRPVESMYVRVTAGAYDDKIKDSPKAALNGREAGWLAKIQWSLYPFGLSPIKVGDGLEVTPLFTLTAQKQWDRKATNMRSEQDYRLYAMVLSIPFKRGDDGFVPSFDVSRSVGADLLQGRARSGKTSAVFSLKY